MSMIQISLPWLHLSFHNACPCYLKSRQYLLHMIIDEMTRNIFTTEMSFLVTSNMISAIFHSSVTDWPTDRQTEVLWHLVSIALFRLFFFFISVSLYSFISHFSFFYIFFKYFFSLFCLFACLLFLLCFFFSDESIIFTIIFTSNS